MQKLAVEYGMTEAPKVAPETFAILQSHAWPGNIRELRNVLSRSLAMGNRTIIQPKDLLFSSTAAFHNEGRDSLAGKSLEEIEKTAIMQTLKTHQGNKTQAAKTLGIAYSTLHEKIKKYGIVEL